jgi:hypothetical protein
MFILQPWAQFSPQHGWKALKCGSKAIRNQTNRRCAAVSIGVISAESLNFVRVTRSRHRLDVRAGAGSINGFAFGAKFERGKGVVDVMTGTPPDWIGGP